ncbi:hypothetical protein G6F68_020627 [Rhizopus microsporus]|nr:hypothetical protein G6F68_020627 [Rhizopus microsporus]
MAQAFDPFVVRDIRVEGRREVHGRRSDRSDPPPVRHGVLHRRADPDGQQRGCRGRAGTPDDRLRQLQRHARIRFQGHHHLAWPGGIRRGPQFRPLAA